MKVTVFNAKKTAGKYPDSPYGDDTFLFETRVIDNISEVFTAVTSNFTLNFPLKKNMKTLRRKAQLLEHFVPKLEYIIVDIDDIDTKSDRALAIKYFQDQEYECILGESRTDYRIKGVLRVQPMTPKEGKEVLREIQEHVPGVVDISSLNYASYQAPTLKHKILYQGGHKKFPVPSIVEIIPQQVQVPGNIEQMCINAFNAQGFSFDQVVDGGYRCSHPSEIKSKGGFTWSRSHPFSMGHWNQSRNVSVWLDIIKTKEYKLFQNKQSADEVKSVMPANTETVNERYLSSHVEQVKEFIDTADILQIQSPMGSGKSRIIEEVIHQSRKNGLKVLFLTNRISLADDISSKYENIKHYLGTEAEGNNYDYARGDDLVVQIDSLHKYSTKFFDVVIMDEAATTLMHLLSLENHQKKIASQIFSLSNRKLVLADAFIFNDMVDVFRPKKTVKIINGYRDDVQINVYDQKDNFIYNLIETAKVEPVTFSSGSTQILKIVKLILDQNSITNLTISGETTKTLKQAIFKSFNNKEPKAQVIMYSPSLTVGVSNENQVRVHFHYDAGLSMDVLSSLQMTKRTRSTEIINLCLSERIKYDTTSLLQIQTSLTDFTKQDDDGDDIGISEAGSKFSIIQQLYNTLENRHKVSFIHLMGMQFKMNGNVKKITSKITPFVDKYSKIVKAKEKQEKLDIFGEYIKMSPEQISDIELQLFAITKEDLYIREFEKIRQDETINLNKSLQDLLISEEIRIPGFIDMYKLNLENKNITMNSRNWTYTLKQEKSLYDIKLKEYGYRRERNIWVQNPVMIELLNYKGNL